MSIATELICIIIKNVQSLSLSTNPHLIILRIIKNAVKFVSCYAVITSNALKINEENIEINQDNTENGIVVDRDCAVFVDGRYVVQVKEQIDSDIFQDFDLAKVKPAKWISSVMPKNSTVGIDINCVSYEEYISIKNELGMNNINLVATENNLVDKIWTDKPASVISEIVAVFSVRNCCLFM